MKANNWEQHNLLNAHSLYTDPRHPARGQCNIERYLDTWGRLLPLGKVRTGQLWKVKWGRDLPHNIAMDKSAGGHWQYGNWCASYWNLAASWGLRTRWQVVEKQCVKESVKLSIWLMVVNPGSWSANQRSEGSASILFLLRQVLHLEKEIADNLTVFFPLGARMVGWSS